MQISKITKCLIKPHYKQQNKCTVYHVKNSKKKLHETNSNIKSLFTTIYSIWSFYEC